MKQSVPPVCFWVASLVVLARGLALYFISLAFFVVTLFRAFVLANAAEVMSGAHIATEVIFLALSVIGIWFAYKFRVIGTLKSRGVKPCWK